LRAVLINFIASKKREKQRQREREKKKEKGGGGEKSYQNNEYIKNIL
jgi:hypothetical protein